MIKYFLHIGRIFQTYIKYRKNINGWDVVIKNSTINSNDNFFHSKSLIMNSNLQNAIILHDNSSIINSEIIGYNKIGRNTSVSNSKIGKYSYIGDFSKVNNVIIGNFCSIASNFKVGLGMHPTKYVSTSPFFYSKTQHWNLSIISNFPFDEYTIEKMIIGNDVWIGENVIIMDGVKVGNGAVIAAGAVVTKDVADYAIVGGVPAKILKFRFPEEIISYLQNLKWWEKDIEWLKKNIDSFQKQIFKIEDLNITQ